MSLWFSLRIYFLPQTSLHIAATHDMDGILAVLLEHSADVNLQDVRDWERDVWVCFCSTVCLYVCLCSHCSSYLCICLLCFFSKWACFRPLHSISYSLSFHPTEESPSHLFIHRLSLIAWSGQFSKSGQGNLAYHYISFIRRTYLPSDSIGRREGSWKRESRRFTAGAHQRMRCDALFLPVCNALSLSLSLHTHTHHTHTHITFHFAFRGCSQEVFVEVLSFSFSFYPSLFIFLFISSLSSPLHLSISIQKYAHPQDIKEPECEWVRDKQRKE